MAGLGVWVCRWGAVALGYAGALTCGPPQEKEPGEEVRTLMPDTLRLSTTHRRAQLPLPPGALRPGGVVSFSVMKVHNPLVRPVELELLLGDGSGAYGRAIGRLALFPPNRPGRFVLRIPDSLATAIQAGHRYLIVELSAAAARVGDDLEITVGEIVASLPKR